MTQFNNYHYMRIQVNRNAYLDEKISFLFNRDNLEGYIELSKPVQFSAEISSPENHVTNFDTVELGKKNFKSILGNYLFNELQYHLKPKDKEVVKSILEL